MMCVYPLQTLIATSRSSKAFAFSNERSFYADFLFDAQVCKWKISEAVVNTDEMPTRFLVAMIIPGSNDMHKMV